MNQNRIRKTTSHKPSDNTTIHYRYDASGNRVEKRVEKDGETTLTRYVRDASGNVMAVYTGEAQAEWHLVKTEVFL